MLTGHSFNKEKNTQFKGVYIYRCMACFLCIFGILSLPYLFFKHIQKVTHHVYYFLTLLLKAIIH